MDTPQKRQRALTPDTLAILVALADRPQTGSEVQSQIIGDTVGHYVHYSSLYDALHRLEDRGLVVVTSKRYTLTDKGWHRIKFEMLMLGPMLEQATLRLARHKARLVLAK